MTRDQLKAEQDRIAIEGMKLDLFEKIDEMELHELVVVRDIFADILSAVIQKIGRREAHETNAMGTEVHPTELHHPA